MTEKKDEERTVSRATANGMQQNAGQRRTKRKAYEPSSYFLLSSCPCRDTRGSPHSTFLALLSSSQPYEFGLARSEQVQQRD